MMYVLDSSHSTLCGCPSLQCRTAVHHEHLFITVAFLLLCSKSWIHHVFQYNHEPSLFFCPVVNFGENVCMVKKYVLLKISELQRMALKLVEQRSLNSKGAQGHHPNIDGQCMRMLLRCNTITEEYTCLRNHWELVKLYLLYDLYIYIMWLVSYLKIEIQNKT